jgi:Ca2+-binding RTX toxin-like protein
LGTITTTKAATIAITLEPDATGTLTSTGAVVGFPWDPNLTNNAAILNTTVGNSHACTITGTTGNDKTNATGHQTICDLGGNDTINAGTGGGSIYLGSGNDTATGGSGTETINGGTGTDTINAGSGANDIIYAGDYLYPGTGVPAATINGGTGHTTCYATTADHLTDCAVTILH